MVDVGVYKGGSVVLYHKVFAPAKLVAIELSTTPLPSLDAYAARQSDRSVVIARGVNQADAAALDQVCANEFSGQPLDLVVDDASHLYAETRATFQVLFPRLRPGALYIIEDWSWAHWPGDFWQKERGGPYFRDKEPLTNLLIELALLCGSSPEVVSRVHIRQKLAFIERGPASVAPNFELSEHYFSRGAPAPRFGPRRSADRLIFASSRFSFRQ
jgi:hypothetical protein